MNNENQNTPIPPFDGAPIPQTNDVKRHSVGPIIGTLVIVVLLVLAAIYFWGKSNISDKEADTVGATNTSLIPANNNVDPIVQNDPESAAIDAELNNQLEDIDSLTF